MKKIIHRDKKTKKIKSETDYSSFMRAHGLSMEEVAKSVAEYIEKPIQKVNEIETKEVTYEQTY